MTVEAGEVEAGEGDVGVGVGAGVVVGVVVVEGVVGKVEKGAERGVGVPAAERLLRCGTLALVTSCHPRRLQLLPTRQIPPRILWWRWRE